MYFGEQTDTSYPKAPSVNAHERSQKWQSTHKIDLGRVVQLKVQPTRPQQSQCDSSQNEKQRYHFLGCPKMVVQMEVVGIDETRKVSFDDLVSGSIGSQDDDLSIHGLVSVPDDFDGMHYMQSESLPLLPAIPATPPTTDLYACFEPPQNPETMRKKPDYPVIIPAPDYCSIYSGYDWRSMTYQTAVGKRLRGDEEGTAAISRERQRFKFTKLLRRLASSVRRSQESRSAILDHREDFKDCFDEEKIENEVLLNETRPKILDMVRKELNHVSKGGSIVIEESDDESSN